MVLFHGKVKIITFFLYVAKKPHCGDFSAIDMFRLYCSDMAECL